MLLLQSIYILLVLGRSKHDLYKRTVLIGTPRLPNRDTVAASRQCSHIFHYLIEEVMTQRRIELWGEGFRWFDLKRLNMDLDRGPAPRPEVFPNGLIEYWNKDAMPKVVDPEASNYNMYGDGTVTGNGNRYRPAGHRDWQWAIPDKETQLNPLCEPNP